MMDNKMQLFSYIIPTIFVGILMTTAFLTAVSAVKMTTDKGDDEKSNDKADDSFPIVYPKAVIKDGKATVPKGKDNCLFYAEGISVVVFNSNYQGKRQTAWADYRSDEKEKPKYSASVQCQPNQNIGSTFEVRLDVEGKADGRIKADIANNKKGEKPAFTTNGVTGLVLTFKFTQVGYWKLTKAEVTKISLEKDEGDFLKEGLSVNEDWQLQNSSMASSNINGFKDYSFACGRTNPIVWKNEKYKDYAVGITLNNVQFQPFNATYLKDGKEEADLKFGRKVNDCQGLFSIGTWMGLIVTLLLTSVLFFGFLMLNSVQTMDRFDDPKQKQLIINAKE